MTTTLFTAEELKALSMLFDEIPVVQSRAEMRGKALVALEQGKQRDPGKGLLWHMIGVQLSDLFGTVH
jgi:hypothetical protein